MIQRVADPHTVVRGGQLPASGDLSGDPDNRVEVIWHDNELVNFNVRSDFGRSQPLRFDDSADRVEMNRGGCDLAE